MKVHTLVSASVHHVPYCCCPSALVWTVAVTDAGAWVVLLVVFSTWACDTGAYLFGTLAGRHKMAPAISPGKTWEGLVCGVLTAGLVGALLSVRIDPPMSEPHSSALNPAAIAAAAPPDEPPQLRAACHGLFVRPKSGLSV